MNISDMQIDTMESRLLTGRPTPEQLRDYHTAAIVQGRLDRAREVFHTLLQQDVDNAQVHSFYIALCLEQGDNTTAMSAIEDLLATSKLDDALLDAALAVRNRIGPKRIEHGKANTISLCMIVRDEGDQLSRCLNNIKSLVDEIIVIDTGSKDRTKEIGRIYGARVENFKWCQDFARARNYSLQHASGDWVLVLDADETIAASDFDRLRGLMAQHENGQTAFTIETRNYCHVANAVGWQANDGRYGEQEAGLGWFPSCKVRLFRNGAHIRFHFPVHERVEPSLKDKGIAIVTCPVPVHHYGHLNEIRKQEKARDYYQLGYAKLDQMGNDLPAIRELAVQAGQLERWQEAIELWQRLLGIQADFPEALVNLAGAYWNLGRYEESLAWAQKAVRQDGKLKEAHFNMAVSWLMLGNASQAASVLRQTLKQHPNYLAAGFMLAVTFGCLGTTAKATDIYHKLQKTPVGPALPLALQDVQARLQKAGQGSLARNLSETFGPLLKAKTIAPPA